MRVSLKQVFTAVVAMICTLGVLWGGQRLYQRTVVQTPLMASVGTISGVTHAALSGGTLTITLKPNADLMTVYRSAYQAADQTLGHAPSRIVVANASDSTLNRVAQSAAFIVAQGEATGQFVALESNIHHLAGQNQVQADVELGAHHLYLTFRQHHHVLYQVVPVAIGGGTHG